MCDACVQKASSGNNTKQRSFAGVCVSPKPWCARTSHYSWPMSLPWSRRIPMVLLPQLAERIWQGDKGYPSPHYAHYTQVEEPPLTFEQNSFQNSPQFDVLIIPGSFTASELPVSASAFFTAQTSSPELTAIFCVSSGILGLAQSGMLSLKRATGPPALLHTLRQRFPDTLWQTSPWTRHDHLWSSKSAISALDMVASWMREYFWDRPEAVQCALTAAGIPPLDEDDE